MNMQTALEGIDAERLACRRGQRMLFRDLHFRLEAGALLSIEGPNGAGKTSLLRMLAGFLTPAAGMIRIRTKTAIVADGEERGQFIGWLSHADAAKPQLTVAETLRFFMRLYGAARGIDEMLATVGLASLADMHAQYLSAGQKRRLALGRLCVSARPLWLLDEPLAALDAEGKALVADLVRRHCAAGGIVIAATHEPLGLSGERLVLGSA